MFDNLPNPLELIVAGAVFGLVMTVLFILVMLRSMRRSARTRRIEQRLGTGDRSGGQTRVLRLWHEGREATTTVSVYTWRQRFTRRMEQIYRDVGWEVPMVTVILGLLGAAAMVSVLVLVIFDNVLLAPVAGAAVIVLFWMYLQRRIVRRATLFERQLVDALQLAARSLRAGHPLVGAFRLIAEDLDDPISSLFAGICQQQQMGLSLERALDAAGAESSSNDMRLFATSVTIQLRSGGNLADMMDRLAFVMRERIRLSRRIRVLTAQTQFSKNILLGLPFLLFVLLNTVNPGYMQILYDTSTGKLLLAMAAAGLVLGAWMMNRLSKITW